MDESLTFTSGSPDTGSADWSGNGQSTCTYPGLDSKDLVDLQIYQIPFSGADERQDFPDFATSQGGTQRTENGFQVWTVPIKKDQGSWQVGILGNGYWAKLVLTLTKKSYNGKTPQQVIGSFVDTTIQGLAKGPTGPATFGYRAPYADVLSPCQSFSEQDFQRIFGTDTDSRVLAKHQLGERGLDPDPGVGLPKAHYIVTDCTRKTFQADAGDATSPGLDAQFEVYRNVDQAKTGEYVECDPRSSAGKVFGPPTAVDIKIGDGRVCYPNEGHRDDMRLVFRTGRTLVYLQDTVQADQADLNAMARKLAPTAQAIAARLARQ